MSTDLVTSSKSSLLYSYVTSSVLGQNVLLSTLFTDTLCLLPSLSVSDQDAHPYKTTSKIIVLQKKHAEYNSVYLILMLLNGNKNSEPNVIKHSFNLIGSYSFLEKIECQAYDMSPFDALMYRKQFCK